MDNTSKQRSTLSGCNNSSQLAYIPKKQLDREKVATETFDNFKCRWKKCTKNFNTLEKLVNHMKEEHVQSSGNKHEWRCEWDGCDRNDAFKARYMLNVHIRGHTGEKPYRCEHSGCKKEYSRMENLKTHRLTHTGEKPYKCAFNDCGKAFNNISDRAKHQNFAHSNLKASLCPMPGCGKSYTDPSSLRKHILNVHGVDEYENLKRSKSLNRSKRRSEEYEHTSEDEEHPSSVQSLKVICTEGSDDHNRGSGYASNSAHSGASNENGASTSSRVDTQKENKHGGNRSFLIADILQMACDFRSDRLLTDALHLSIFDVPCRNKMYHIYRTFQDACVYMDVTFEKPDERFPTWDEVDILHAYYHHSGYDRGRFHARPEARMRANLFWRLVNFQNSHPTLQRPIRSVSFDEGFVEVNNDVSPVISDYDTSSLNSFDELTDEDDVSGLNLEGLNILVQRRRRAVRREALKRAYVDFGGPPRETTMGDDGFVREDDRDENNQHEMQFRTLAFVEVTPRREEPISMEKFFMDAAKARAACDAAVKNAPPIPVLRVIDENENSQEFSVTQLIEPSAERQSIYRMINEYPQLRAILLRFVTMHVDRAEIAKSFSSQQYIEDNAENDFYIQHRRALEELPFSNDCHVNDVTFEYHQDSEHAKPS